MRGGRAELAVGVFALVVLAALSFITFKIGDFAWGKKKGYRVYVIFKDTAGLYENTEVKIAGVNSGVVEKIELVEGKARVTIRMNPGVKLYTDAEAYIKAAGLLGDRYMDIKAGSAWLAEIKDGGTITKSYELVGMEDMLRNLSEVSSKIIDLMADLSDPKVREAMKATLYNIESLTGIMNSTAEENRERFNHILARMESLVVTLDETALDNKAAIYNTVANIEELTASLRRDLPGAMANISEGANDMRAMMNTVGPDVAALTNSARSTMTTINSVAAKIDRGEGTLGKLVHDDALYNSITGAAKGVDKALGKLEKFRTFITFRGDYLDKIEDTKGSFYLTLQPRADKYYVLGVIADPIGKVKVTETITDGEVVREEEIEEDELEFTAHFARRFRDTALRIGLTESTLGMGADQFFLEDKLQFTADLWDFGDDEADAEHPHLRVGADYFLFKNIFLSGGGDNLLNSNRSGFYLGGGLRFEDEDFKYIFGNVPRIPGQ